VKAKPAKSPKLEVKSKTPRPASPKKKSSKSSTKKPIGVSITKHEAEQSEERPSALLDMEPTGAAFFREAFFSHRDAATGEDPPSLLAGRNAQAQLASAQRCSESGRSTPRTPREFEYPASDDGVIASTSTGSDSSGPAAPDSSGPAAPDGSSSSSSSATTTNKKKKTIGPKRVSLGTEKRETYKVADDHNADGAEADDELPWFEEGGVRKAKSSWMDEQMRLSQALMMQYGSNAD